MGRSNRPRWTGDNANLDAAAAALAYQRIVTAADYLTSATLESECTVHRVLLHGTVRATAVGVAVVTLALFKGSASHFPTYAGVMDPGLPAQLWASDCMWTDQCIVENAAGYVQGFRIEADIRTKRQLQGSDELILVASNAGAVAMSARVQARVLLKLKA